MTDEVDKPDGPETAEHPAPPPAQGQVITVDGTSYHVSPTAFRSHYQVMASDGTLLGLIEMVDAGPSVELTARPASGAGMTTSLMMKIAEAAMSSGILK
jgi:hypothetical protein